MGKPPRMIEATCPACGKTQSLSEAFLGEAANCVGCKIRFRVPEHLAPVARRGSNWPNPPRPKKREQRESIFANEGLQLAAVALFLVGMFFRGMKALRNLESATPNRRAAEVAEPQPAFPIPRPELEPRPEPPVIWKVTPTPGKSVDAIRNPVPPQGSTIGSPSPVPKPGGGSADRFAEHFRTTPQSTSEWSRKSYEDLERMRRENEAAMKRLEGNPRRN